MPKNTLVNKWYTLVASALVQAFGSPYYTFSVYAPKLKDVLQLNQTQVEGVGAALHVGCCIAQVAGLVYSTLSDKPRLGPRVVLWIGCVLSFVGYSGMYLIASGSSYVPASYPLLVTFAAVAGNSASWYDTSTIVTCVRNFPGARGTVVGLLKAFVGVGGSAYACFYVSVLSPDSTSFILWTAILSSTICLLLSSLVNYVSYIEASDATPTWWGGPSGDRFLALYVVVLILSLQQAATALLQGLGAGLSPEMNKVLLGVTVALMLLVFTTVADSGSITSTYGTCYEAVAAADATGDDADGSYSGEPGWLVKEGGLSDVGNVLRTQSGVGPLLKGGSFVALGRSATLSGLPLSDTMTAQLKVPLLATLTPDDPDIQQHARDQDQAHQAAAAAAAAITTAEPAKAWAEPAVADDGDSLAVQTAEPATADGETAGSSQPNGHLPSCTLHELPNHTLSQCIRSVNCWLLFFEFTVATGSAVTFQNNLAQIFASAGGDAGATAVLVSLYSVSNSIARLVMGYYPERMMHSDGVPRTSFLLVSCSCMFAMSLVTAYASPLWLYAAAVLAGLALGAHWTLVPAIISDLFGVQHFAANYTFYQFAPAIGGFSFGTVLAGWQYDVHAEHAASGHTTCTGPECFKTTFLILAVLCGLGTIAAARITFSTRGLYKLMKQA
eukprot:jgi/Chrzof1/11702/Cz06g06050.t1